MAKRRRHPVKAAATEHHCVGAPEDAATRSELLRGLLAAGVIDRPDDPKVKGLDTVGVAKMLSAADIDRPTSRDPVLAAALTLARRVATADADSSHERTQMPLAEAVDTVEWV